MRKFKYILTACLLSFMACFAHTEKMVNAEDAVKENPILIVNDYEDATDLNSMMMYSVLGKVETQKDANYVSHGESSAKITVAKDVYNGNYNQSKPYLFQAMSVEKYGVDYRDFTFVQCVEFDIYNASTEEQRVGVCLRYNRDSVGSLEWRALAPQAWTTVRYNVTRELLPTTVSNGITKRIVAGINLSFDRELEDTVYYLDAMRIYRTNSPVGSSAASSLKEHEISAFEQQWQVNALYVSGGVVAPQFTLSKAFSSDGGSSLRIETAASSSSYYYVDVMQEKLFPDLSLKQYTNDDYLCFDVYSPTQEGYSGGMTIYIYTKIAGGYLHSVGYTIAPGNLLHVRIPVKDINQSPASLETGEPNVFAYMNRIRIGLSTSTEKFVLFMDNIRIEKGQA